MGFWGKLFDVEETIEDSVIFEQQDEETDIDAANDALFNREDGDDCVPEGKWYPPKQRVWWRL